jgi:7-cyano-7-deazaguanine synthase
MSKKHVVLSLSGGLDSSSLLLKLLKDGYEVTALSFDIAQKHKVELERATELVEYLNSKFYETNHRGEDFGKFYPIKHQIIKLEGLSELLVSGLINNNSMELKTGHYAHENALTTVVPNRNSIFASIVYAVALSVVKRTGENCKIALGTHMGDFDNKTNSGIYPDCSEEFRVALEHAFKVGNWDSEKVDYYAPYNITDKTGVLKDGIGSCKHFNLDYKEVYSKTNTSYAPIQTSTGWLSDYKSGSSIERIISFIKVGLEDPLQYAEEDGSLVSWDFVKQYALQVEEEFISSQK